MHPIAKQALDRAMSRLTVPVHQPKPVAKTPPKARIAIAGKPAKPEHLDQFGFREGRNYALDTINSMPALLKQVGGLAELTESLMRAATGRPVSQALGIWSIIEMLEGLQK